MEQLYSPQQSHLRVGAACPEVNVADVNTNVERISELYDEASNSGVSVLTFPELSITGYTLGDLVQQTSLLNQAEQGLTDLAEKTDGHNTAMVVGLPLRLNNGLYNCAAVLADGKILGIVPKSNLPTYNEFYEDRWYQVWDEDNTVVKIDGQDVPFGTNILFDIAGVKCGLEICEDLWANKQPSEDLAELGAQVILNPSASPEQIGKADYRRMLVQMQSARLMAGYVYAGCDFSESTAEIVMGGHQIIAVDGRIAAERQPFGREQLLITDLDVDHIGFDRRKQHMASRLGALVIDSEISRTQENLLEVIEKNPFLPNESAEKRAARLNSALQIQAHGLASRMKATHQERVVIGLSGGLDSTLALIVAMKTAEILNRDPGDMIETITMPGMASSEQTQDNAQILAEKFGVANTVIPIGELAQAELKALGHDGVTEDITYENVQARARANILFNYGNLHRAMVLGTGDLSEIALGWCTYNADQQSHYHVNATIPKTMVKHLVQYAAELDEFKEAGEVLQDIIGTPISPELTSGSGGKDIQTTEDIIGPYELHDFFLYHLIRWGDKPSKIHYLANEAFDGAYDREEIGHWLGVFIDRFSRSQFKRDTMPNGPKVGSVSLSYKGDWRMPSDLYNAAIWSYIL